MYIGTVPVIGLTESSSLPEGDFKKNVFYSVVFLKKEENFYFLEYVLNVSSGDHTLLIDFDFSTFSSRRSDRWNKFIMVKNLLVYAIIYLFLDLPSNINVYHKEFTKF